jgi:hypothetical protein
MYGIAFSKRHKSDSTYPMCKTWHSEIRDLYTHYFLIDLVLHQSTTLTDKTRTAYRQRHRLLNKALDQFIRELEKSAKHPYAFKQAVFNKHVRIIQVLNKSVYKLLQQHQFISTSN